jgi:anti-sigma B factor antagonist/stage II sporulation protein AA (anti-sigma F factor antagonist)
MPDPSPARGEPVVVEPVGSISARAVSEFERKVREGLETGARDILIDFSKAELISGDGIRVLMMVDQQLRAAGRHLLLCGLPEPVRRVFDVSGMAGQFQIVLSREDAVKQLAALAGAEAPRASASKLSRLVRRLIDTGPEPGVQGTEGATPPELRARVRDLLAGD